jgi:hypothetical protein
MAQHFLLKDIDWDCDGMRPVEDCLLPLNVLAINVPPSGPDGMSEDQLEEHLSERLSDTYGFLHYGFTLQPINLDGSRPDGGFRQATPWNELCQAVMDASE